MSVPAERQRSEVLRRCFDLAWEDQYAVWEALTQFLLPVGEREPKVVKQLRERAAALESVRRAAEDLKLPVGQAPTIEEYEDAHRRLGLPFSRGQVERRWEGWEFVRFAIAGERPAEAPAQRAVRQARVGRLRTNEEPVEAVRLFLADDHFPAKTRAAYDEWARRRRSDPTVRPVAGSDAVTSALVLVWADVLRVARGSVSLKDARSQRLEELTQQSGRFRLIGRTGVALVMGTGLASVPGIVSKGAFPPPAVVLRRDRLWYRDEVEAYRDGHPSPPRPVPDLQAVVMDSEQVSTYLGMSRDTLNAGTYLNAGGARRPDGQLNAPWAPPVAGRAGSRMYFLREDVERWKTGRNK